MKRKLSIVLLTSLISINVYGKTNWKTETYAEKGVFTYSANINQEESKLEYKCSVIKFDNAKFAKILNLNIDLNLQLENEKLNLQDKYKVNFIYPNGEIFTKELMLSSGNNGLDRFRIFINKNKSEDYNLINNILNRSYVNIEIEDNKNRKIAYRFYLKGSKSAIDKTSSLCDTLYVTFK